MASFQGKFVWYELMTTDTAAAQAFYTNVFGWSARDAGMTEEPYTLFAAADCPVCGMMALPERATNAGARPGWIGYVAVDDVDVYAARVTAAGGRIYHGPSDIPGVGRFAVVGDPEGTVFALFKVSADQQSPPVTQGTPGHPGWRELQALDPEAAFAFYASLFGWTKGQSFDMDPLGVYQIFERDGEMTGGMMAKPASAAEPHWLYYFNVESVTAASARVAANGGKVLSDPREVPGGGWIVHCADPAGALFALFGPLG